MALTKIQPNIIAVANNVTNKTVGNTTSIPSFTFDGSGVVTSASNVAISGAGITANTVANSAFQTGSIESYMRAINLDFGLRNRVINGQMVISQRYGTSAIADGSAAGYTLDRWTSITSLNGKFSIQQDSSANTAAGFTSSLKVISSSAYSVPAGQAFILQQAIEGYNVADLGWGTANARPITLSFMVRSSLTGTFGGVITNSGQSRTYPFTYTISTADTWEYKTITIPGDTSGTWLKDNGIGMSVFFNLGTGATLSGTAGAWAGATYYSATGATSVVGTSGATFYITGVQLEEGSQATPFEYRHFTTELQLCQRYYWQQGGSSYTRFAGGIALGRSSTIATSMAIPPVTMRAFPSISSTNIGNTAILGTAVSSISVDSGTDFGPIRVVATVSGGLTTGTGYEWESNNNSSTRVAYSSEL